MPRNILPVVGTFSALFVFVYIFVYLHAKASTSWPSQEIGLEDELVASFMFFFPVCRLNSTTLMAVDEPGSPLCSVCDGLRVNSCSPRRALGIAAKSTDSSRIDKRLGGVDLSSQAA